MALAGGSSAKQKGEEMRKNAQYKKKDRKMSVEINTGGSSAKQKGEDMRKKAQWRKKKDTRISVQSTGLVGRLKAGGSAFVKGEVKKKKRLTGLGATSIDSPTTAAAKARPSGVGMVFSLEATQEEGEGE